MERDQWNKDIAHTDITVQFGWLDWLRITFGRSVLITSRVKTENVIGRTESEASVHVRPIFPRRRLFVGGEAQNNSQL